MMKKARLFQVAVLMVTLLFASLQGHAQNVSVRGTVSDEAGAPLIGVNVYVDGTAIGTATGSDGSYQISVAPNAEITYQYVGYDDQVIPVAGRTTINVTLTSSSQLIDDVVVIGYGTQRASDVTGSIASLNEDAIKEVPATSIAQVLQSRLPGVEVVNTSAAPGGGTQIRIRGSRSLTATNDPLIVVDGIPYNGDINDIAPGDIKNLDVLKDASATAIYGSRGANGVILITTSRGGVDETVRPVQVRYDGYYGIKTHYAWYPTMNNQEFQEVRRIAGKNNNNPQEQAFTDAGGSTDWQKLLYDNPAHTTNHNVSVSAGTRGGSYSLGIGYQDETSFQYGEDFTRMSIRFSVDQKIGKFVRVGLMSTNAYTTQHGGNVGVGAWFPPSVPAYNEDGSINKVAAPIENWYNPLLWQGDHDDWFNETVRIQTFNSLYGEVNIWEGLKYRINLGLSYNHLNWGTYSGKDQANGGTTSAEIRNNENAGWTVENLLTYNKAWGKHRIDVVGMYSAEQSRQYGSRFMREGIFADYLYFYNLSLGSGDLRTGTASNPGQDTNYRMRALLSYMGRVNYAYDNRYMATFTVRSDGASVLADGHKWRTYTAGSLGWNISNESFMQDVRWISMLKLRAGYGETGSQAVDPYATLGDLGHNYYNYGRSTTMADGFYANSLPNPSLGWESSTTFNAGIDFSLWGGRLSGSVDAYLQKTKDLLMARALPQTSGVRANVMQNIGKTENKGIEFALNGQILRPADPEGFRLTVGVNGYLNRNKIVALAPGETRNENRGWFLGHPINVVYDYEKIGIWQTGEDTSGYGADAVTGNVKVKYRGEYNADGTPKRAINAEDRAIIGTQQPDLAGGFNIQMGYKKFDLSIIGGYQIGGMMYSSMHGGMNENSLMGRRGNIKIDYWTEDNPTNVAPKPGVRGTDQPTYFTTLAYFGADYLKIRTITLGYTFDFEKIGLKNARAYFQVDNVTTLFSPYVNDGGGMDIFGTGGVGSAQGGGALRRVVTGGGGTPPARTFILGLNLTF